MKTLGFLRITGAVIVASVLAGVTALAQVPGGSPTGVDAALAKLFGDFKAFSAKADVRVLDKDQQETMSSPMNFALLDQKIRVEIDLSKMKSRQMPAGAAQQLKQMGMEQITSIIRPDKKQMYIIYPATQSCLTMAMPKEETDAIDNPPKIEKSEVGNEMIDGHPCVKTKVTMTDAKGQKRDALTWNATDLKNFPVQIQTTDDSNTLVMRFSQVQFTVPEAAQFDPPNGYTKYSDMQEMMMGIMKKMMTNSGGK